MAETRDILEIRNFAQLRRVTLELGDLTVLVGAQATGKSLTLQLLKAALDGDAMASRLRDAGVRWARLPELYELYLGGGMGQFWGRRTRASLHTSRRLVLPVDKAFYVPAHRAAILSEGWPLRFEHTPERSPIVARLFSDALYRLLSGRRGLEQFPARAFGNSLVELLDGSLLHGARVSLGAVGNAKRLELFVGSRAAGIQFQAWSTGQRELMPLLLGLSHVIAERDAIDWVIIEEPEMGLHPRGIEVTMLLILDLIRRGFRVVLSTHSPVVLEVIWGLQRLSERNARVLDVLKVFNVPVRRDLLPLAKRALTASYRVFALEYEGQSVVSRDISRLDPGASDATEAFWGGLTEFGARMSDMVAKLPR